MVAHLAGALLLAHAPFLDDPLQVIHDPVAWVMQWLGRSIAGTAADKPGWVSGLFASAFSFSGFDAPTDCRQGPAACTYFSIWFDLRSSGYVVLGVALLFRLFKVLTDPTKQTGVAQWLVADVLIRGSLAGLAIEVSYVTLADLLHGSIILGGALFEDIMSIGWANFAGPGGVQRAEIAMWANSAPLPLLLEGGVALYLVVLTLASRVAMLFAIALAPLLIPIYAYSGQSSLVVWWLRIVGQGLLVPIVLGPLLAVALSVILTAQTSQAATAAGPLLGSVTAIAGLWFVAHAIQQLVDGDRKNSGFARHS